MPRNYWMVVATPENYRIARDLGFKIHGLKAHHHRKVQRIEPGDRILYYIGGSQCFAATATVTSKYFEDRSGKWKKEGNSEWAFGVHIRPEVVLDEQQQVDARQLAPRLDYVRRWDPDMWYVAFAQSNLHLLPKRDFVLVEEEMRKIRSRRFKAGPRAPSIGDRNSNCALYSQAPMDSALSATAPESSAVPETMPENSAPPETVPESSALPETAPESSALSETAPESSAPSATGPESSALPATVPESPALPATMPESSAPSATGPESSALPATVPESSAVPERAPQAGGE